MNICVLVFCVIPCRLDWSLLSAHGTILWEISQLEILHRAVHMARCGHWAGFRAIRNPAGLLFSTTGGAIAHLARGGDRTVRHLEWRREFHMKRRCKLREITPLIHTLEYRTLKTNVQFQLFYIRNKCSTLLFSLRCFVRVSSTILNVLLFSLCPRYCIVESTASLHDLEVISVYTSVAADYVVFPST